MLKLVTLKFISREITVSWFSFQSFTYFVKNNIAVFKNLVAKDYAVIFKYNFISYEFKTMSARSYYPTYFSIEDIMVTQEKVPCKTNVVFPRLGFLSADNEEEDLNKDMSLNIPIWLAKKLVQKRMNLIRVEVPNPFKEKARDVFDADATVVNLFRVSPNFYEFGLSFSHLKHRESELIRELLIKVFRKRFKMIFDWSIHRMTDSSKIQQLDLSEQRILKAGQKASELLDEWFVEAQFKMKPAEMVVSLKKRKLLERK